MNPVLFPVEEFEVLSLKNSFEAGNRMVGRNCLENHHDQKIHLV